MNILLIYPAYPDTYWSFRHALKFVSKKASNVPLGLLTVASLLPADWNKKITDLNVGPLREKELRWADYVMISAMSVQWESARQVIERCRKVGVPVISGGPLFTEEADLFEDVDHLILNEAEITLPEFIKDLQAGKAKKTYFSKEFADLRESPVPDYSLVKLGQYATAGIQYSRGCPFDCEFCDITALFGHRVRTKTPLQVVAELDNLLDSGWKGPVFFVDDNFIGHKKKLKTELLPAIIRWMKVHRYPFTFITETSVDLADDEVLMDMMVIAGFSKVFVGIETPDPLSLNECNKVQNSRRDLMESIRAIQHAGLEVAAGFIVGFDSDKPDIFQRQVDFIQNSGIITAMVGLLNAPRLSRLYKRLKKENRITESFSGDNTGYQMNFTPKMDREVLLSGYQHIISGIYSSKPYYERVKLFIRMYQPPQAGQTRVNLPRLLAFFKSVFYLGIFRKNSRYYWDLLIWCLFNKPRSFPLAVTYSIYGYHFQKVFREVS